MKVLLRAILALLAVNEATAEITHSESTIDTTQEVKINQTDLEKIVKPELLQTEITANLSSEERLGYPWPYVRYNQIRVDQLLLQGWKYHVRHPYRQPTWDNTASVWPPYNNVWWMLACRQNNAATVWLGAFTHMSWVRRRRGWQRYWQWGAYWYHVQGRSIGLAPNSHISLNSADTSDSGGSHMRLSWHYHQPYGGWRCGQYKWLNGNTHWKKLVMYLPNFNYYNLKRNQNPPTGIFNNRLRLSNLWSAGWRYTINPNGYYSGRNYYVQTDNRIWPKARWMMLGCRYKGYDRLMLGAFARVSILNPHRNRLHRRRNVMRWEHGTYWYSYYGRSIGFAPTSSVSLNSADTQNSYADRRLSWHFPGSGWRCGDIRGTKYNDMQKVVMYYGKVTTTTTTTTTLAKMKMVTWVLPEKIKWKVFKGGKNKKNKGKPICSGGPYNKWYSTISMDCNLKKGTYTIDCMDAKGFGWGEGYVQVKKKKLCKKFLWKGQKRTEQFTI